MKQIILFMVLAFALNAQEVFREGYIIKIEKPESLNYVDRSGETNTLRPAKGKKFIAIHFVLRAGRSLGKYDYVLKAGNLTYHLKSKPKWEGFTNNDILNKSSQFICVDDVCLGRY